MEIGMFFLFCIEIEIGMNWKMEIEIDWEWFDKYGIENRNRNTFQYGNIYINDAADQNSSIST